LHQSRQVQQAIVVQAQRSWQARRQLQRKWYRREAT